MNDLEYTNGNIIKATKVKVLNTFQLQAVFLQGGCIEIANIVWHSFTNNQLKN